MLDPNLNIWVLLLYLYTLYGCGYALGRTLSTEEGKEPSGIVVCFTILFWPFVKGVRDGMEQQ